MQEVRLYAALSLCHILRINAPDTPYTDEQLQVWAGLPALLLLLPAHVLLCCLEAALNRPPATQSGYWHAHHS